MNWQSPLATVNEGSSGDLITAVLSGKSITTYTTIQLVDDADGITQECPEKVTGLLPFTHTDYPVR